MTETSAIVPVRNPARENVRNPSDTHPEDMPVDQAGQGYEPERGVPGGSGDDDGSEKNQQTDEQEVLSENSSLKPKFVSRIAEAVFKEPEEAFELASELHPADMADLLEQLKPEPRQQLVAILGSTLVGEALAELDEDVRDTLIESMPAEQLAETVTDLDTDDAAFILEDMEEEAREEVLAEIPIAERLALQAALEYTDESAGRLMQREVFSAPAYWTVGQIIDRLRTAEDITDNFYEVFIIDPAFKPLGSVSLARFLRSPRDVVIGDLITEGEMRKIPVDMDQEEVAYLFEKYNLISAPVVDAGDRLVGMITVDDVVEIVHEESHEDMLALAGVDSEQDGLSSSISKMVRSRFTWLLVNLGTAILASLVISLFGATIEQAVALAVLMPIVASMGGNAGTQTLTIAVRNLATRDLTPSNAMRIVGREAIVASINGAAFAVVLGFLAALWYHLAFQASVSEAFIMALVLGAAMIITMLCAGLAGILIPLTLQKAGADPAVSSAVFVTTVTDIVAFFAFLGLAAVFIV